MKRTIVTALFTLLSFFFLHSNLTIAKNTQPPPATSTETIAIIQDITPREAWKLIQKNQNNPKFVILDVRTPKEFFSRRIPGAINTNFYDINFKKKLSLLDPHKTYLIYCKSGFRSRITSELMERMGFKKLYNMKGGIEEWEKLKLPLKSGL